MKEQQTGDRRANALGDGRAFVVRIEQRCTAPAEVVYDLLADLRSHLEWAGALQGKKTRLVALEAPEGPAAVGTEFESTGADPMGRFSDRSVVTEAVRPGAFEFVTEARLETKKGEPVDWTVVHRFDLSPDGIGCRIVATDRVTRISALPGMLAMFKIPVLRSLAAKVAAAVARRGVKNLASLAERQAPAGWAGSPDR